MRSSITALLLLLVTNVSLAHVPGSEQTILEKIEHQLVGLHHLPMTALLIIAVVLLVRSYRKRISSESK